MSALKYFLPSWLGGSAQSASEALAHLASSAIAQPESSVRGAIEWKEGRQEWKAVVLQLGRAAGPDMLQHFMAALVAEMPPGTELTFATETRGTLREPAYSDDSVRWLQPHGHARSTELRSFLFARTPALISAERLAYSIEGACRFVGLSCGILDPKETWAVLGAWAAEPQQGEEQAALEFQPQPYGVNPVQVPEFGEVLPVDSWQSASFKVPEYATNDGVQVRTTAVFRGLPVDVAASAAKLRRQYERAGFSTCRMAGRASKSAICRALPWLAPWPARDVVSVDSPVGQLLPLAQGGDIRWGGATSSENLLLRDAYGTLTPLDFRAQHPNGCVLIQGLAGSGVTYLSNAILGAQLQAGGSAWAIRVQAAPVFDDLQGARSVVLRRDKPQSLNPLSGFRSRAEFEDELGVLKNWLLALADVDRADTSDRDRSIWQWAAEAALVEGWRRAQGDLGLPDVLAAMANLDGEDWRVLANRIRERLQALGLATEWFEGKSSLDTNARYLSFDLSELNSEGIVQCFARTLLVLHSREVFVRDRREQKMLLVDDWRILGRDGATGLLSHVIRRMRPYNGLAVLAGQPMPAEQAHCSPHERLVWDASQDKLFVGGIRSEDQPFIRNLREPRLVALLRRQSEKRGTHSRLLWDSGSTGRLQLLELQLPPDAALALAGDSSSRNSRYWELRKTRSAVEALTLSRLT